MTSCYEFAEGNLPLLVSVPHDGRMLPADVADRMTAAGLALPDTDWHVARLYGFTQRFGASVIVANYSRYVVDLNRSSADESLYENQRSTGLCPRQTFAGEPIYRSGQSVNSDEQAARVVEYWQPYHDKLLAVITDMRKQFGYALLWDAHSIQSLVPSLFEGELPELNIGSNRGASCPASIVSAVLDAAESSPHSCILDGRFTGGYITRRYGAPKEQCCALQLELAQRSYMDETSLLYDASRAALLAQTIENMIAAYLAAGKDRFQQ